jgi:hypothetical protein
MASKFSRAKRKNPADAFLSMAQEPDSPAPAQQDQKDEKAADQTIPEGYRLVKETKSERMQLLVRPSIKKRLKAEAQAQGLSMNDLINNLLEEYIERSGNK